MKEELYQVKVLNKKGLEGTVFQHNPDKFYKNTPDKWFVTNGAYLESERPGTYKGHI